MAVIKRKETVETVMIQVRVPMALKALLEAYAGHVNGTKDYVVAEAVEYAIGKDKEFIEKYNATPRVLETVARVRRAKTTGAA